MRHWYVLGLVLLLVGCGGSTTTVTPTTTLAPDTTAATTAGTSTTTVAAPTTTTTTAAPATEADADSVKKTVRAYSDAFLGGHAKEAWLMRTPAAQAGGSYAEFAVAVAVAKEIYGDAEMTSLEVTVTGDTASATYTYDIAEINQIDQVWIKQGGEWFLDN